MKTQIISQVIYSFVFIAVGHYAGLITEVAVGFGAIIGLIIRNSE